MDSINRRSLLAAGAGVAGALAMAGAPLAMAKGPMSIYTPSLPKLPYPTDGLEPVIDKQTVWLHHSQHHAGYVKGYNEALAKLKEAEKDGDYSMVKHWTHQAAYNGSGHILHTFYWESMKPQGGTGPSSKFHEAVKRDFGSFETMTAHFKAATVSVEASGWGILGFDLSTKRLVVLMAEKHQDQTIWGCVPLLVCDVWEHAYYLKYQNRRGEYIDQFWSIVDWEKASQRYEAALEIS